MTTYAEIFNAALAKISDPALVQWPEEDLSNELYNWLRSAIAKLPQLRAETTERDAFDPQNTETLGFAVQLSDVAKEVLALGMAREWLSPQIASTTITWQSYSKSEGYSQANHLKQLMELDEKYRVEIKKLLRDNTYVTNEYLD